MSQPEDQARPGQKPEEKDSPRKPTPDERQEQKRDLTSWWRNFKRSDKKAPNLQVPQGIFGVALQDSIRYANVAISLLNDEGQSYIYGYVPIVVAKCGVFLKEKATETEGIFRLAGSEKRIKELKIAFDSPDRFGKGLDWTGYTVHDAANILRRYFNQLPEPIIPLEFYAGFRDPLRNHQAQAVGSTDVPSPSAGGFDLNAAINEYQRLITLLPPLNRQLLLYILDLLAVFASKADLNKMTTPNLAAIFQPGILSHPQHDMAPAEYRLSQDVLIFLIDNQDSFLIGMQGTAADAETVRDVQSGTPTKGPSTPTTPGRSKTIIGRSSSNASNRAESLRKLEEVRRNNSSSSKQSKREEDLPSPVPAGMSPTTSVHRSSTMPSRRDGSSPRFTRDKASGTTPSAGASPLIGTDTISSVPESLEATPVAPSQPHFSPSAAGPSSPPKADTGVTIASAPPALATGAAIVTTATTDTSTIESTPKATEPIPAAEHATEQPSLQTPASSSKGFLDRFKQSPPSETDSRKPNKLQKRPPPSISNLSSAQSSSASLPHDNQQIAARSSPISPTSAPTNVQAEGSGEEPLTTPRQPSNVGLQPAAVDSARNLSVDNGLRPSFSPSQSYHSGTESDADLVGDDQPLEQSTEPQRQRRRHRWQFSRTQNKLDAATPSSPPSAGMGILASKEHTTSRSTIGSSNARRSFQEPAAIAPGVSDPAMDGPIQAQTFSSTSTDPVFSDSERERRGPMSWIREKIKDRKEKDAEKRTRTPDRNRDRSESNQGPVPPMDNLTIRSGSPGVPRDDSEASLRIEGGASGSGMEPSNVAVPIGTIAPATVPDLVEEDEVYATPLSG